VPTVSRVGAVANPPNALSPLIRSQTPPAELVPAHRAFKNISNAYSSDEEQLTSHVIATAALMNVNSTIQVWTRLGIS
jgi:hypothetical protein